MKSFLVLLVDCELQNNYFEQDNTQQEVKPKRWEQTTKLTSFFTHLLCLTYVGSCLSYSLFIINFFKVNKNYVGIFLIISVFLST